MVTNYPKKIEITAKFFARHRLENALILDVGGTALTWDWLQSAFPNCRCYQLNAWSADVGRDAASVVGDGTRMPIRSETFDTVVCFDTIEHMVEPDNLLGEIYRVLKEDGWFVVSTVNLSSIYNRVLLLLGFSPLGYSASRHRVGTPFPAIETDLGHKSVFTYRGLRDLLKIHGFKVTESAGFCYYEPFYYAYDESLMDRDVGFYRLRRALDKVLLKSMKEAIWFISKKQV